MKKFIAALTVAGVLITSSPIVSEAALGDRVLKQGMQHSDVTELKTALKASGHLKHPVSNFFNYDTKVAVQSFQRAHGLNADGIVGKQTIAKLPISKKSNVKGVSSFNVNSLVSEAKKHSSVPYKWGGTTPKGFDCSGFLGYVFKQSAGIQLPRTVDAMYQKGQKVSKPAVGDIVFFETYKKGASHAGIYLGNNQFIHSSSSKGVSIASLNNSYWKPRYLGAKKITQ
ncbi:NlpC/P60 family protein [Bacillus sp. CGMCC 1.16541]|uniref:C40 family peptidase n=1 Tax=Bacillus sp. CGMCC 1.16541 TaxID=2185143 RepID=UPI000D73F511|nr:NlpC/P60 family protein [Bacillus sp. CGMCC 1.16541]